MKFSFSKNSNFTLKVFSGKRLLRTFRHVSKYIIGLLFILIALWLGYVWYASVYAYEWTEDQKNQYRSEYAGETSFRQEKFTRTVDILKERIRIHQTPPTVEKDIFLGVDL